LCLLRSCAATPPDLHSFPTRRSSDLAPLAVGVGVVPAQPRHGVVIEFGVGEVVRVERGPLRMARLAAAVLKRRRVAHARLDAGRSEEHTSELQSRENLVCRLLLEKKK